MKIDRKRIINAQVVIHGDPRGGDPDGRRLLIEEAISKIQTEPETALAKEFLGFKNYAQFGDQRTDCAYGYGPKHGSIVFSIGRQRPFEKNEVLGADDIYYLQCERDFPRFPWKDSQGRDRKLSLYETIHLEGKLLNELQTVSAAIDAAEVEIDG